MAAYADAPKPSDSRYAPDITVYEEYELMQIIIYVVYNYCTKYYIH